MNFLHAIQHATIGYGIRRKVWPADAILSMHLDIGGYLVWVERPKGESEFPHCKLLGPDQTLDLQHYDITAEDWETI